ncbi:MAG: alanine--tRNA ligase, partial [Bacteroidales bacterium]|nr:alanine--tRNA ligase [Bacteroidales bacterium]
EAIEWAWELLTEVYKIDKNSLYVTVFEGDETDKLPPDEESYNIWKKIIPEDRIFFGSKKDNFWEMGETGPCGPCSEIHVDLRIDSEKKQISGSQLINKDHPHVIEIWNLVFIEFNRTLNGKLNPLPAKHVDTGLGFERLSMVIQGVKSNYATDIFQPIIQAIAKLSGTEYGKNEQDDIAMRVIADHLRAVTFAIADGQLPSNTGAGYVIRRILRRAVRYGFTFLGLNEAFINELVPLLVNEMGDVFPDIKSQQDLIIKVIIEEELAFLRTLSLGIKKFEQYISKKENNKIIDGNFAFELFDTYGFPVDLTQLMAKEKGWKVDMEGFNKGLNEQKNRSRKAAEINAQDWIILNYNTNETEFAGYNNLTSEVEIVKYRKVKTKNKEYFELILNKTPFYAESGGQVGDTGYLKSVEEKIIISDTKKENNLILHISDKLPSDLSKPLKAIVDAEKRLSTSNNHTATHLLHAALKEVLGDHVEQKGSLVDNNHLRFDFSHYAKLSNEDILKIEKIVNNKIRENITQIEKHNVPLKEAQEMGAVALFGEKYDEKVRVIIFDKNFSIELCGGTHVPATGQIGSFKIISESAIAAGIRRIEAITSNKAEEYYNSQNAIINELKNILKNQKDIIKGVKNLIEQNNRLQKQLSELNKEKVQNLEKNIKNKIEKINNINFIAQKVTLDAGAIRNLAFNLKNIVKNLFLVIGSEKDGKANLTIMISDDLVKNNGLHAGKIIKEIAKKINGGGGGQPHFATAGGKNPQGIPAAFEMAKKIIQ